MAVSGYLCKPENHQSRKGRHHKEPVSMTFEGSIDMLSGQLVQSVSTEQRRRGFV
jgi:hypothetical protein